MNTLYDSLQKFSVNKELSKHFSVKPYVLKEKKYIFIQVTNCKSEIDLKRIITPLDFAINDGNEIDLERMIVPLDSVFSFFEHNEIYNLIFSLKCVIGLSDIALAIVVHHVSGLASNGGELILCDANESIITTLDILEFQGWLRYYSSEEEMLKEI